MLRKLNSRFDLLHPASRTFSYGAYTLYRVIKIKAKGNKRGSARRVAKRPTSVKFQHLPQEHNIKTLARAWKMEKKPVHLCTFVFFCKIEYIWIRGRTCCCCFLFHLNNLHFECQHRLHYPREVSLFLRFLYGLLDEVQSRLLPVKNKNKTIIFALSIRR